MTRRASEHMLASFDLETTSVDPEDARIVQAALVVIDPRGEVAHEQTWLIDPIIDIPDEATAVHGITTAHAREHGLRPWTAVGQILAAVYAAHTGWRAEESPADRMPLVIFNAPYDLTVLDREVRRHLGHGMLEHMDEAEGELAREDWIRAVFDPLVIDRHIDRYRPGSRRLTAQMERLGVTVDGDAHDARADAIAAARVLQAMMLPAEMSPDGREWPVLDMTTARELHLSQIRWKAEQAAHFQDYLHSDGRHQDAVTINPAWPMIEHPEAIT